MPTPDRESSIAANLRQHILENHQNLTVMVGNSGLMALGESVVPSPDLLVSNANGEVVGIEVKNYEGSLPFGAYPQLKASHLAFAAVGGAYVAVTGSAVPQALIPNIATSGINVISYKSKADIYPQIDQILQRFEAGGASARSG